ncbi:DUF2249 domain-containing protein [Nocardioides piscis]|uniref:DUF2249 domain-containing protein n=1 Tax=Nocardioides piscis TaxID=2714938 RepID=A0A6G7YC74_9ACTN|nr:DUF2249 domain-containing protein [Nocardioides piscis]
MSELVIASNEADAHAAEAVEQHHAVMAGALALRTEELVAAASRPDPAAAEQARQDLVEWCERELVPHALAEEKALYPVAQATTEGRLLVEAMLGEHVVITSLLRQVSEAADPVRAAATATALRAVFDSHLTKENELLVPLLARTPDVSLHDLLGGMHELLGHAEGTEGSDAEAGCGGHTCSCGEVDGPGHPELDVRTIPHAIRHATIFGALESVRPGGGLELVAPHDPLPLLAQLEQRWPAAFSVTYNERGPEAWRITLVRSI